VATPSHRSPFRRRSLFKAAGLGAAGAAGLPLISACGELGSNDGAVQVTEAAAGFIPEFKEFPLPVQPDLVGEPPLHPSGFLPYPEQAKPAIPNPPSNSGTYEITVPMWGDAPSANDAFYQAVYDAWGGTTVKLRHADGNTFADTSTQWLQANEFGDGIHIFSWMLYAHANFTETVANRFYDLSEILAGQDISERWPLLAGRPSNAWGGALWATDPADRENTTGIYGIPGDLSGGVANYFYARTDLLEDAGLGMPESVEEILEIAREWSDDRAGRWAFGGTDWFTGAWFGLAGNRGWKWDGSGLVHNVERPEYAEWIEFRRTLNEERLQHPDLGTDNFDGRAAWVAGDIMFGQGGTSDFVEIPNAARAANVELAIDAVAPLAFKGRTPLVAANLGVGGWLFLNKDLEREQVEEILDCANFCASPYGTSEWELLNYGIEGTHFTRTDDGTPEHTDQGAATVSSPVNFYGFSGTTQSFITGEPDIVQRRFEYNEMCLPYFEPDLFAGLRLEDPESLQTANQILDDQINDIVYGRAELSTLPDVVEKWKENGGDASRGFFEDAYKSLNPE
jgi:putative aldouronate transport system substrate-binding protein